MTFDWHMLYPLHKVIFDNSQVFGGVPCKAQLCNFSKWFFSPRFGVVPIWELWQFCYVRIEPPKLCAHTRWNTQKAVCGHRRSHVIEGATHKAIHTQKAVHTQGGGHIKGGLWPPQESCYLRGHRQGGTHRRRCTHKEVDTQKAVCGHRRRHVI